MRYIIPNEIPKNLLLILSAEPFRSTRKTWWVYSADRQRMSHSHSGYFATELT
jgi:hypothetical protein